MSGKSILLLGGGGHCVSVLDALYGMGGYATIGIVSQSKTPVLAIPVVGEDTDLPKLLSEGYCCGFVAVGSIGDTSVRRKLFAMLDTAGFEIPNIIDPSAVVSEHAALGRGIFIGKNAVVNGGCTVEDGAILNTGSILEHDCRIGAFSHISPGTVLCGAVQVGADAHVGANSTVIQGKQIGAGALIGAGSVVTRDIPEGIMAYGNPCRERKRH